MPSRGDLTPSNRWLKRRWRGAVSIVFAVQLALILWLGRTQPPPTPRKEFVPGLRVVSPAAQEVLAFTDPTLFALPHREGFSGLAWLNIPIQDFRPVPASAPPRLLGVDGQHLGEDFKRFMLTNQEPPMPLLAPQDLVLRMPAVAQPELSPTQSTVRLTGGLAGRRLARLPVLRSWPSPEILSNSVVQLLVGASGETVSAILLNPPGSGSAEADQYALRQARKARFDPVPGADPLNPLSGVSWGEMVFQWRTVPMPSTNAPAEPSPAK